MLVTGSFEKAKRYIESHPKVTDEHDIPQKIEVGPCITISRETGARADRVAKSLEEFFEKYKKKDSPDWTIFDKNLIDKVLEDHNLPSSLRKIMEEEKYSMIKSIANELIAGQPNSWTLVHDITETILQLAQIGNVIIVGRAANIVTLNLTNAFHVRLISEMNDKIKHVMKVYNLNRMDAIDFIKKDDAARQKYAKTYFNKNVDDLTLYHLVINTHLVSDKEAAEIIGGAVLSRFPKMFNL